MPRQPTKLPKPTPAELDLLRVIWRLGPSTVRDVHAARVRERPELTYATALRLMQVMHGKGLLIRDESERSHVYATAHAQDALQTNLLGELMELGKKMEVLDAQMEPHSRKMEMLEERMDALSVDF